MKGSIGIIGGSISGLSAALSLRNKGFIVRVFERSKKSLQGRGAGIGVSQEMLEKTQKEMLVDRSLPQLTSLTRSFLTKDLAYPDQTKPLIKSQPFKMIALNWQHIYCQLQAKLPPQFYHTGESVTGFSQDSSKAHIETEKGHYDFDYVIGADGINSSLRTHLFPKIKPEYADYIGWRGVCEDPVLVAKTDFKLQGELYLFEGGHIILYKIPGLNYDTTKQEAINWVLYEHHPGILAKELLVDKNGNKRAFSIPPGMLSTAQKQHISDLATEKLPANIAAIVRATRTPFAQGIYDLVSPEHVDGKFILLGDAATSLRPHVGAGVVKAIEGAIGLSQALDVPVEEQLASLNVWNESQKKSTQALVILSKRFGESLVTASPDWTKMDESMAQNWWADLMKGKIWYPMADKTTFWATNKNHPLSSVAPQKNTNDLEEDVAPRSMP